MAEEIEKLRRMAQRGDRKRLSTLMKDVTQIVAEEVVEEQPGNRNKVPLPHCISMQNALLTQTRVHGHTVPQQLFNV